MRQLLLLRHAKSSWDDRSLPDFERPLNDRGRRAAPLIGREMKRRGVNPDSILSSPATRTRETVDLVVAAAGLNAPVRFDERIYEASVGDLLAVIADMDDAAGRVLLVGHNPGLENLLARFTGELRPVPTAALAALAVDAERWRDVPAASARLEWFVKPRDLDASAED